MNLAFQSASRFSYECLQEYNYYSLLWKALKDLLTILNLEWRIWIVLLQADVECVVTLLHTPIGNIVSVITLNKKKKTNPIFSQKGWELCIHQWQICQFLFPLLCLKHNNMKSWLGVCHLILSLFYYLFHFLLECWTVNIMHKI